MIDDIDSSTPTDRAKVWLLYANFAGDVEKTAFAAGLRPTDVIDAAAAGGWNEKLKAVLLLRNSQRPGDLERAINRSLAFVQATRLRLFLDRVLAKLSMLDNAELEEYLFQRKKARGPGGSMGIVVETKVMSCRALADLASAMEKVSAIASQALCDTAADRSAREESSSPEEAAGALHAQISLAMQALGADTTPRSLLFEAQLAAAKQIADRPDPNVVENPKDSDEH